MLPDGCGSKELRLYESDQFPLKWRRHSVLIQRPMIDATLVEWNGLWWMFTSDVVSSLPMCTRGVCCALAVVLSRGVLCAGNCVLDPALTLQRTRYCLELFFAETPLGPWTPHAQNPVANGSAADGGRMGGRIFDHAGQLYRLGQDCGETYGRRLLAFEITTLSPTEYRQIHVPLKVPLASWNSARYHHLDAQKVKGYCPSVFLCLSLQYLARGRRFDPLYRPRAV
jgi:hypothetical protein